MRTDPDATVLLRTLGHDIRDDRFDPDSAVALASLERILATPASTATRHGHSQRRRKLARTVALSLAALVALSGSALAAGDALGIIDLGHGISAAQVSGLPAWNGETGTLVAGKANGFYTYRLTGGVARLLSCGSAPVTNNIYITSSRPLSQSELKGLLDPASPSGIKPIVFGRTQAMGITSISNRCPAPRVVDQPVIAGSAATHGAAATSRSPRMSAQAPAITQPASLSAPSVLGASFAVLRTPTGTNAVPLPPGLAGQFTGPAQPPNPYQVDPSLARYAAAADTWVLPGASGVCLYTTGIVGPGVGSEDCASTSTAVAGEFLVYSTTPSGETALVGLAPDGNTSVSVLDADGSTRHVPVADNVYIVMGGKPSTITLLDASGTRTTFDAP